MKIKYAQKIIDIIRHKNFNSDMCNNHIYLIDGLGNKKEVNKIKGITINFIGENNTIEIYNNPLPKFNNCQFTVGNNGYLCIHSSKYSINKLSTYIVNDSLPYTQAKLIIGEDFSINGGYFTTAGESGLTIQIGNDCMFATGIYIRPSDGHVIYDIESFEVINPPNDIIIGNHVWLAKNVIVLKGSIIPDDSVVGLGGIYTKSINNIAQDKNIVLAGNPLRIVRKNVNWERCASNEFKKHLLKSNE